MMKIRLTNILQSILDGVVEKWLELDTEYREEFRSTLQGYIRLYGYISQLITFNEVKWEKLYVFGRSLNRKLPKREHPDLTDLLDSVDLDSFRVQRIHASQQLFLEGFDSEVEGISSDAGTFREQEQDLLSNIVSALNEAYQTEFTAEHKVDIENIYQKVRNHEELQQVVEADNTETNIRSKFDDVIDEMILDFVNSKLDLYKKLSKADVNEDLKNQLYQAYREQSSAAAQRSD